MRETTLFLTIILLLGDVASKPTSPVQNDNDHTDQNTAVQGGTHPALHEMDAEEKRDEGETAMNKENFLGAPDPEIQEDEEGEGEEMLEEDEITAEKRGGGGSLHRTHNRRNHTVGAREKKSDKSSEEDKLVILDHMARKRSTHDAVNHDHEHDHEVVKRAAKAEASVDDEDSDGSFDGLEYVGDAEDKENDERMKRNHHHEAEEPEADTPPTHPYDMSQHEHVESVVPPSRVKRVNKAGSSHRNRLIAKNKGNSRAGQAAEAEQPPAAVIDSV